MRSTSTTSNHPPSLYRISFITATLCFKLLSSPTVTTAATTSAIARLSSSAFNPISFAQSSRPLYRNRARNQQQLKQHHKILKSTHIMTSSSDSNFSSKTNQSCPLASFNLPSPLILGSNSFTRKLILEDMNIPFILKVKPINEYEIGVRENESYAKELVLTLAKAKANALINGLLECNNGRSSLDNDDSANDDANDDKFNLRLTQYSQSTEYIVLTADQVVTCNDQILEKPTSVKEACSFIEKYSKHPPQTVGSIVLTHLPSMKQVYDVDVSTIHFKPKIGEDCQQLVQKLLDDDAPILSCAGGLMIEHRFVQEYIDNIDGSVDGVMGLSKELVFRLLKKMKAEIS